jgi:hypothetical protein
MLLAVPAEESAQAERVVGGEGDIGFPAEAVGSEIFAHDLCFLSQRGGFPWIQYTMID